MLSLVDSVRTQLNCKMLSCYHRIAWWRGKCKYLILSSVVRILTTFPGGAVVKNLPANAGDAGDMGSIPGSGRSSGEGNGNPFQYSCLGNPMDRGCWRATMGSQRVRHDLATKQQCGKQNVLCKTKG